MPRRPLIFLALLPLLPLPISQFQSLTLSLGRYYLGFTCFGPYAGRSHTPIPALSAVPVLRPFSLSTFLAAPTLDVSRAHTVLLVPWWLIALPCLLTLFLAHPLRRRPTRSFPILPSA
jgi:hypothetical protein